jgi:uncharacterized protein involved in exopolysaccharide biosynthesis
MVAFAVVFGAIILFGLLLSDRYEARMEILVDQSQLRRADPVLTGNPNAQPIVNQQGDDNDAVLNSEIALIESQDVLRQVVEKCGLNHKAGLWGGTVQAIWKAAAALHAGGVLRTAAYFLPFLGRPTQQQMTAKAIERLTGKLHVEVLQMSNVISVTYRSNDPQLAARVLNTLGDVYLKEHALAHHPPGELKFFQKQTDQARSAMQAAEAKLTAFTRSTGVASGQTELDNALRRLSDEMAGLDSVHASIAGTEHRIDSLRAQEARIPERQVTQLKTADSDILLQHLKTSLLDLETKRTALLTQYQPNYPLVTEVNKQIAQTRSALADAEKSQLLTKTTDRDPNYEMVRENLTQSSANLDALRARAAELNRQIAADSSAVKTLQQESVTQQDLMRNAQAAQANYVTLLHKEQAAQISEALDQQGVFNVNVVQRASVPALPIHSAMWYVVYGGLLSILCAFATAVGAQRLDPTVRTLDELESILGAPVLAVMPLPLRALPPPRIVYEE